MNIKRVHDLAAPVGFRKQACCASAFLAHPLFYFHYIMNFVHDLQLRSHACEQARRASAFLALCSTTLSLYHEINPYG